MRIFYYGCLFAMIVAPFHFVQADENDPGEETQLEQFVVPEELKDSEFDKYVELEDVQDAWLDMDQEALVEIAEKLHEGERALNRSAKIGDSKHILMAAARAAAQRRDKKTLQRIAELGTQWSWGKTNDAYIQSALKIADQPRAASPAVNIDANEVSGVVLDSYHTFKQRIESAKIAGDSESLEAISHRLTENADSWPDSLRNALMKAVEDARSSTAEPDESARLLNKLIGGSRIYGLPSYSFSFFNTSYTAHRVLETRGVLAGGQLGTLQTYYLRPRTWKSFSVQVTNDPRFMVKATGTNGTPGGEWRMVTHTKRYFILKKSGKMVVRSEQYASF